MRCGSMRPSAAAAGDLLSYGVQEETALLQTAVPQMASQALLLPELFSAPIPLLLVCWTAHGSSALLVTELDAGRGIPPAVCI